MKTLTISLPDSLKAFNESEVRSKGYGNVSEYVRTLVRQAREREADERLEALLWRVCNLAIPSPSHPNSGAN